MTTRGATGAAWGARPAKRFARSAAVAFLSSPVSGSCVTTMLAAPGAGVLDAAGFFAIFFAASFGVGVTVGGGPSARAGRKRSRARAGRQRFQRMGAP